MSDIVERLRGEKCDYDRRCEAADEIERLREALRHYASANNWEELPDESVRRVWLEPYTSTRESYNGYDIARDALGGEK